jgi:hypothetical protein
MSKTYSKDVVLDPGTFGGTKACHVLAEMMNQNVISVFDKHKVLSFINKVIYDFNAIATITYSGVRGRSMMLMKDHYIVRAEQMPYPEKFISFMKNVINHHARRALKYQSIRDDLDKKYRLRRAV